MGKTHAIPCAIIRGGTSKGIFIKRNQLPADPAERDRIILKIFGSPDVRQIDGLGGADTLTSKLAIIGPSTRPDADVDYTFGQVSITEPFVDYGGNCGNISSAVGPFAIDEGMVEPVEPVTVVRIHCTNSGKLLIAHVPVKDGKALVEGDCRIDGVNGTGARIDMDWSDMSGSICGKLLPTGNPQDTICADGKEYQVSLVDMGNPLVFIRAEDLRMKGTASPAEIEADAQLMKTIEAIRCQAAQIFGLVKNPQDATSQSPYNPFFAILSPSAPYTTLNGKAVHPEEIDFVSRLLFMLHVHKAYPISGTVCTAAASRIPGTIPWELVPPERRSAEELRIGHPSGVVTAQVKACQRDGQPAIEHVAIYRTARRIMDGNVYIQL